MSSHTHSPNDSTELPAWGDLTRSRRRLLRIIGHFRGPRPIERPDLRVDVDDTDADDVEEVIDDKDRILKTLNSCGLLNKLTEEDGYLQKLRQGGGNPIVVDYDYEEDRDTHQSTIYADTGQIATMAFDVLDREDEPAWKLDDVDMDDPNEIISAVNRIVGYQVLGVVAESSEYRLVPEAIPVVEEHLEADIDEEVDNAD